MGSEEGEPEAADQASSPSGERDAEAVAVSSRHVGANEVVRVTFPTPYQPGDVTPQAEEWAAFLNQKRSSDEAVTPPVVGPGDNYQVVVSGPAGAGCGERQETSLGHFPVLGMPMRTVPLTGVAAVGSDHGHRCGGRFAGWVEFRQPGINFRKVPYEVLGRFSFVVNADER